jgi:hypothetical protein
MFLFSFLDYQIFMLKESSPQLFRLTQIYLITLPSLSDVATSKRAIFSRYHRLRLELKIFLIFLKAVSLQLPAVPCQRTTFLILYQFWNVAVLLRLAPMNWAITTSIACSGGLVRRQSDVSALQLLLSYTALQRQPPAIEAMQS